MSLTAAERQKRRRDKLKKSGEYSKYKARIAEYSRNHRLKLTTELENESERNRKLIIDEKRRKDRARQALCRQRKMDCPLSGTSSSSPQVCKRWIKNKLFFSTIRSNNPGSYVPKCANMESD